MAEIDARGWDAVMEDVIAEAQDGPEYLFISFDMDTFDPAFVPGISHHEPGGLTTRELLRSIQNISGRIIGADIVEYNPHRDLQTMTSMVAAKLLKELAAKMLVHS
jgi:arginase family enzyme